MARLEPVVVSVPLRLGSLTLVTTLEPELGSGGACLFVRHRWRFGRMPVSRRVAFWIGRLIGIGRLIA